MLDTLNHDAELPISDEDCLDYLGGEGVELFFSYRRGDVQRIGQAWMNALWFSGNTAAYRKLTGTFLDPFYRDDWLSVRQALMFLLEN